MPKIQKPEEYKEKRKLLRSLYEEITEYEEAHAEAEEIEHEKFMAVGMGLLEHIIQHELLQMDGDNAYYWKGTSAQQIGAYIYNELDNPKDV